MAERLDLTTPVPKPSLTSYRVTDLVLHFDPPTGSLIQITLVGDSGDSLTRTYRDSAADPVATTFLIALNKANLSVQSLQRRILARLVTDGVLAGAVSGTPD